MKREYISKETRLQNLLSALYHWFSCCFHLNLCFSISQFQFQTEIESIEMANLVGHGLNINAILKKKKKTSP